VDFDAGAREGAAGKVGFFGLDEAYGAVNSGMDGVIAGKESAGAGDFGAAGLADEDFAAFYFLSAKAFDAKALTCIVVDIFAGSASLNV